MQLIIFLLEKVLLIKQFFTKRKILLYFLMLSVLITLCKFYYEERKVTIKEQKLIDFILEKEPKPKERIDIKDYEILDKIYLSCSPYNIEDAHLGWYWDESNDLSLIKAWHHFNSAVAKIGIQNIDTLKYNEKKEWFQGLVKIRKFCIPYYIENEKTSGNVLDAMCYGITNGLVFNIIFFKGDERQQSIDRYFMLNEFYLFSKEKRGVNFLTSSFFSIGLLLPWFLIVFLRNDLINRKQTKL
jgi:hypothetical protein